MVLTFQGLTKITQKTSKYQNDISIRHKTINKIYEILKKKKLFYLAVLVFNVKKTSVTLPNFGQMTFTQFWQLLSVTIATIKVKST